jgi:microcystin degradation protein MlrC
VSGFYSCLQEQPDVEPVFGFVAYAVTSGKVLDRAFFEMTRKLLESLRSAMPVDGILLSLHGAMQAESIEDCEGYILEKIRSVVGNDVCISAVCDLHACLTKKMMECSDALAGYMMYPHTDYADAGRRAAASLLRCIREGIHPVKLYRRIPLIMPVENCSTTTGPIVPVMEGVRRILACSDVLAGGLFLTQPWLDVPDTGCMMGLFLLPGTDVQSIKNEMDVVLDNLWAKRREFLVEVPLIDEALSLSLSHSYEKPCCIVELGDIVSAGGTGDSTVALEALLRCDQYRPAALTITAPAAVCQACEIGVGAKGHFILGTSDSGYNKKISVEASVEFLSDQKVAPSGETQKGVAVDAGMRALLRTGDLWIIAGTYPCMNHDKEMFLSMGLDPARMDIIIQKTHQMFKTGFKGVMKSFLYADTPGETDRNLKRLPYKLVRRPVWPLDEMDSGG